MRPALRLSMVGVLFLLAWPAPAPAYIDGPYGLGSIIQYSEHIFVMQVEKVSADKRVVIYKKVANLKGNYPGDRVHHQINDGSRVVLEWADTGKLAICFIGPPNFNHPVLTAIDHYWYLCSPNPTTKGWWNGDGMPFLCWAYFGTAEKLRDHVKTIVAGKEAVITAVQHGGEGISRWSDYTSLAQARKYPVWRIKASPEKAHRPSDKKTDLLVGLGAGGAEAVPALVKALKGADAAARIRAANELAQIGGEAKAAVPILAAMLKETDPLLRVSAAEALAMIDAAHVGVLPALVELLKSDDGRARAAAAEALGKLGPPAKSAVSPLVERLKDERPPVRRSAAWALMQIGPEAKPAFAALTATLTDKDVTVRRAAAWALVQLDPSAEGAVLVIAEALKDPDWMYRREASNTLAALGPRSKPAATLLADVLADPVAQGGAIAALKALGPQGKAAVPNLLKFVTDPRYHNPPQARHYAVELLGEIGPDAKAALPALTEIVKRNKDFPEVMKTAAEAIKKIQK